MSWCYYKDLKRKAGSMLRTSQLPAYIVKHLPDGQILDYVIITERQKGTASLQLWAHKPGEFGRVSTVISFSVPEDPEWIIERH